MPRWRARFVMFKVALLSALAAFCLVASAQAPANELPSNGSTLQSLYDTAQRSQKAGDLSVAA